MPQKTWNCVFTSILPAQYCYVSLERWNVSCKQKQVRFIKISALSYAMKFRYRLHPVPRWTPWMDQNAPTWDMPQRCHANSVKVHDTDPPYSWRHSPRHACDGTRLLHNSVLCLGRSAEDQVMKASGLLWPQLPTLCSIDSWFESRWN